MQAPGGDGMDKCIILIAAVLLAAAGVALACLMHFPAQQHASPPSRMTELGLMLLEEEGGVYVLAVTDNSLACRAGIEPGDLLTEADGVTLTEITQLEGMLQASPADGLLHLCLTRDGMPMTLALPVQ